MRGTEKTLAPLPLAATRSRPFGLMAIPSRDSSAKEPTRSDTRPEAVTENSLMPLASLVGAGPEEDLGGVDQRIDERVVAVGPEGHTEGGEEARCEMGLHVSEQSGRVRSPLSRRRLYPPGTAVPEVEADVAVALKVVSNATALAPTAQATTYR